MSTDRAAPDLIFVTLIHQALRTDGDRLVDTVGALEPEDRKGRLPRVRAVHAAYREQLVSHHTHEDHLFFPALVARVGEDRMHLLELTSGHQQLDGVLEALDVDFAALADPNRDFSATRTTMSEDLSTMVETLNAHLDLEEKTALPLFASEMPTAEYDACQAKARKATPGGTVQFHDPVVGRARLTGSATDVVSIGAAPSYRLPAHPASLPASRRRAGRLGSWPPAVVTGGRVTQFAVAETFAPFDGPARAFQCVCAMPYVVRDEDTGRRTSGLTQAERPTAGTLHPSWRGRGT